MKLGRSSSFGIAAALLILRRSAGELPQAIEALRLIRHSDQHRAPVNDHGLPGAKPFLHEEEIGERNLVGFADATDKQTVAYALVELRASVIAHILPKIGSHHTWTNGVHSQRSKFHSKCAGHSFDGPTNTSAEHPSFVGSPARCAGRQYDGAAFVDMTGCMLHCRYHAPIT